MKSTKITLIVLFALAVVFAFGSRLPKRVIGKEGCSTGPCRCYTWIQGTYCHNRTELTGNCLDRHLYKCNGYDSEAVITGICKKGQKCYEGEVGSDLCPGAFDNN